MTMWTTGVRLLGDDLDQHGNTPQKFEFLRGMMLQYPDDRQKIIKELILHLILAGKHREALDELELYLPSFPYQDNPLLHVYAGLISLYLAQPASDAGPFNPSLLRDAELYLERAKVLDPDNTVAQAFLDKIPTLSFSRNNQEYQDSDDDNMDVDGINDRRKRIRDDYF